MAEPEEASISKGTFGVAKIQNKESWGHQLEFFMSSVAFAVGLGNVWRFPATAAANGGGSFIIPYFIILFLVGMPLLYVEMGLGQFTSLTQVSYWDMCPAFRGVGIGICVACYIICSYYVILMAWAVVYFMDSFKNPLPWENNSDYFEGEVLKAVSPEYFASGKGLGGSPVSHIAIASFVSWLLLWAMLLKGVSGGGKLSYFTALMPYVLILILMIRAMCLENSSAGLMYLLTPDFKKLVDPTAWAQAAAQCFFSVGCGLGCTTAFASFNKFDHRLVRDVIAVVLLDTLISVLSTFCIFSMLGHLSLKANKTVEELSVTQGNGLAFVAFPDVLSMMGSYPGPQAFSAFFYFMLMTLALGSANGLVGLSVTVVTDFYPTIKPWLITSVLCVIGYLLGLVYMPPAGTYVLDVVDHFSATVIIFLFACFELIGVMWVYGARNFINDMEFMLSTKVSGFYIICWAFITPTALIIMFLSYLAKFSTPATWPVSANVSGYLIATGVLAIIPGCAIYEYINAPHDRFKEKLLHIFKPLPSYGPLDPDIRERWRFYKAGKPTRFTLEEYKSALMFWKKKNNAVEPAARSTSENIEGHTDAVNLESSASMMEEP